MTSSGSPSDQAIEQLYRHDWARILATLVRQTRDLDTAEDALQEAIARAVASWPVAGVPGNPAGWVSTTAQRIAVDQARRATSLQGKLPLLIVPDDTDTSLQAVDAAFGDDRLRLIFTCCHPVLAPESRLALTLRMICGLSTPDIASLFLAPEATMAARITRAKKKLTASGVPYHIPAPQDLESRLHDVLTVVYLVATAAHTPANGVGLYNTTHMQLALNLTRVLQELVPNHPDVTALRALILMTEARKETRLDELGNAQTLEHMDRSLWDADLIAQALSLTELSLQHSSPDTVGSYTLQAAIAAVHTEAPSYNATDWQQIVPLYSVLNHRHPSAVARLGHAIAVGMYEGPASGLAMIDAYGLDTALPTYPMLPAARADLYRRSGDFPHAAAQYAVAAERATNETLRRWFDEQAQKMRVESA